MSLNSLHAFAMYFLIRSCWALRSASWRSACAAAGAGSEAAEAACCLAMSESW